MSEEELRLALRRAWNLGQTYYCEADSESYAANRRSVKTMERFQTFVEETVLRLRSGNERLSSD